MTPGGSPTRPWARVATVYAILALAIFAYPGGLVDWLDERNASGWLDVPLALVRAAESASTAIGVKGVGEGLRKRFAAWIGEDTE